MSRLHQNPSDSFSAGRFALASPAVFALALARPPADYRQLVIEDLALENTDLRAANRQLVDLIADMTVEFDQARGRFIQLLKTTDDRRRTAEQERDEAREALALYQEDRS